MPTARADLYLDDSGKATTEKTDKPYLQTGAVISPKEAKRVNLKDAYKQPESDKKPASKKGGS